MFVWFVVTLHVRGNADIQHSSSVFITRSVLLLNASCPRPLLCRSSVLFLALTSLFAVQMSFSYLYWISYDSTLIRFYIDVCSPESNCHACISFVLNGVFEIFIDKSIFYLKDMFVWGTKGSFKLMRARVFFLCVGERVFACQTKSCTFLKLFRWRL